MTNGAAIFHATFSDFKLVKTRNTAQFIFEVPVEAADAAIAALGGLPRPNAECWVGIARLMEKPAGEAPKATKEHKRFHELPLTQQACIRCGDESFRTFIQERYPSFWNLNPSIEGCVRTICLVDSRKEFDTSRSKGLNWIVLNKQFEAWKAVG